MKYSVEQQEAGRAWLATQEVRIKRAVTDRFDEFLRILVHRPFSEAARERIANEKERRLLQAMKQVMTDAVFVFLDCGPEVGDTFLDFALPLIGGHREPLFPIVGVPS